MKTKSDVKIPEKTEELIKIQKMEIEQLRQNLKVSKAKLELYENVNVVLFLVRRHRNNGSFK